VLWNKEVQADREVPANRPDNKEEDIAYLLRDVALPSDRNRGKHKNQSVQIQLTGLQNALP
jgi:hypothetical protein